MATIVCRKYLEISWDLFGVFWEMWENVGNILGFLFVFLLGI